LYAKDRWLLVEFLEQPMWRAFFFAVGTMLIILGLECLVTERFVVQGARIPGFVAKVLDGASKQPGSGPHGSNQSPAQTASSFGPSRLNDNFAGPYQPAGNYYGGVPSSSQGSNANPQFSLAGFGKQQSTTAPATPPWQGVGRQPNSGSTRVQSRVIQPKDWMPWSLLAAGSLVVLYTNTTAQRSLSND
jgi:hypothetical protein